MKNWESSDSYENWYMMRKEGICSYISLYTFHDQIDDYVVCMMCNIHVDDFQAQSSAV